MSKKRKVLLSVATVVAVLLVDLGMQLVFDVAIHRALLGATIGISVATIWQLGDVFGDRRRPR